MFEKCLYYNSNALARTTTRIWIDAYKKFSLSPPHAFLVKVVLRKPGIYPREIAKDLSLSRSTVTRFLDRLEKKGFITRKSVGKDGREKQVHPTPKAEKISDQLNETKKELMEKMRMTLGDDEITKTVAKLREVRRILEEG